MATKVVQREADVNTKVLVKGLKNIWKWECLEKKVNDEPVRRFIKKLNARGLAKCELCNKEINYGGRGWKNLEQHMSKKLHRDNRVVLPYQSLKMALESMYGGVG